MTSGVYHIALKRCGFGARWRNLLKQESICLSERVGRGAREGPARRGNPAPGWFITVYLRRWGIPLLLRCCSAPRRCAPGAWDSPWKSICSPRGGWDSAPEQSHLFYPGAHLHSTGPGNRLRDHPNAWCLKLIGLAARHFTSSCAAHTNSPASVLESEPGRIFLEIAVGAGTFLHRQNVQTLSLGSTFVG